MRRGAEYKFIPTDPEDIIAWLTAHYEEIMGVTVHPASPERNFIQWMSKAIVLERVLTNYTGNQNIPSRAVGENLDALAELVYTKVRPQAKAAACTMRFTISEPQNFAVLVPKGTRVTDARQTLVWETLEDVYVDIGKDYVDTEVQCQTEGKLGNGYVRGQIDSIIDPFAYLLKCENLTESDGGMDTATDEEFYEIMRLSMDAYSCAGARGAYIYWAKQVSTKIADVAANSPTPGVVKLYVLMDDGTIATEEIKREVLEACRADDRRPLTDLVYVEDAEIVPYDIQLTYYIPQENTESGAAIEAAVKKAVEEYVTWQCGKLGRDINPSKLYSLLMKTGVKRIDLVSPVFTHLRDGNPILGADLSYDVTEMIPQLAQVNPDKIVILNGGYEDE